MDLENRIARADWHAVTESMHGKGYALISGLLTDDECEALKNHYGDAALYRKTVVMERYRFGLGEYKYFNYPLPEIIQNLRANIYRRLAPIANLWFNALDIGTQFPAEHQELLQQFHSAGQQKATPLVLKYGPGGFNTLHQDLYGDVYFPMQAVIMLSEPDKDFTGGEFILMQQNPRAQSKAMVVKLKKGDVLIFTTNFKPEKGSRGYYRVNIKHGVSEVHSGNRYALGLIFHDALS